MILMEGAGKPEGVGVLQEKLGPLFVPKTCDILYPIYDLTKNSKPYCDLFQTSVIISSLVQTNV